MKTMEYYKQKRANIVALTLSAVALTARGSNETGNIAVSPQTRSRLCDVWALSIDKHADTAEFVIRELGRADVTNVSYTIAGPAGETSSRQYGPSEIFPYHFEQSYTGKQVTYTVAASPEIVGQSSPVDQDCNPIIVTVGRTGITAVG